MNSVVSVFDIGRVKSVLDFTEYMRSLGYNRVISVDNFRCSNFELVAELLFWLVTKYDPSASIPDDISTEDLRVEFLQAVAQTMRTKANLKLNPKRLYAADGKAVKELIKIAKLLYDSVQAAEAADETYSFDPVPVQPFDDLKSTRALATQITEHGATLFDLLEEEKTTASERQAALNFLETISTNMSSNKEHQYVESKLEAAIDLAKEEVAGLERQCEELESDKKTLKLKIQKKQGELERNDKRLRSLQSVRPAFMDDYERLEGELEEHYQSYLEKFRNLDYLQHQLDLCNEKERVDIEENERNKEKIQRKVKEDNKRSLRPVSTSVCLFA